MCYNWIKIFLKILNCNRILIIERGINPIKYKEILNE